MEQAREDLQRDFSLTQIGVAIPLGPEFVSGVIEVETARVIGAEQLGHGFQKLAIPRFFMQGVASRKGVTCVDTDADAGGLAHQIADGCQVLQAMADERTLTSGVLEQDLRVVVRER